MAQESNVPQAVKRVLTDASYRQRAVADPAAALKEMGVTVPPGVTVKVLENTADTWHFPLPLKERIDKGLPGNRNPVVGKVIERAWTDRSFKDRLLKDPKAAIAEAAAVTVPASVKIQIHEDTPAVWHFVMPYLAGAEAANVELSDAELARVAGGKGEGYAFGGGQAEDCGEIDQAITGGIIGFSWGWNFPV
jgi:hypothetical protein